MVRVNSSTAWVRTLRVPSCYFVFLSIIWFLFVVGTSAIYCLERSVREMQGLTLILKVGVPIQEADNMELWDGYPLQSNYGVYGSVLSSSCGDRGRALAENVFSVLFNVRRLPLLTAVDSRFFICVLKSGGTVPPVYLPFTYACRCDDCSVASSNCYNSAIHPSGVGK